MYTLRRLKEEVGVIHWVFEDTGEDLTEPVPQASKINVHTLIVSDTHLGTSAFKARAFLAMLNTFWIEKYFILLGDIFQDNDFKRLSSSHWGVLSHIRKLTKPGRELDEIWIEGNHDSAVMTSVIGTLLGLDVRREFSWEYQGKKYLAIHGDIFHFFLSRYPIITKIIILIYTIIQHVDPNNRHIAHHLSDITSHINGEHKQVADGAAMYAQSRHMDYVICGHTHLAMRKQYGAVEYLNTGCWVKDPCSFVTIGEAGPILNYVYFK